MRSFEHGYLFEQPISQALLMTVRMLGEFRGRQNLYQQQSPEVLETLKRAAMVQSVESSNRIEGVTVEYERLEAIMAHKIKPKDRSEQQEVKIGSTRLRRGARHPNRFGQRHPRRGTRHH